MHNCYIILTFNPSIPQSLHSNPNAPSYAKTLGRCLSFVKIP